MSKSRLGIHPRSRRVTKDAIPVARRVQGIKPYVAVSSRQVIAQHPERDAYKLDWNEATVPPSPNVINAITGFVSNPNHLNWYPELNSTSLIDVLAEHHDLDAKQFLVTNGRMTV